METDQRLDNQLFIINWFLREEMGHLLDQSEGLEGLLDLQVWQLHNLFFEKLISFDEITS